MPTVKTPPKLSHSLTLGTFHTFEAEVCKYLISQCPTFFSWRAKTVSKWWVTWQKQRHNVLLTCKMVLRWVVTQHQWRTTGRDVTLKFKQLKYKLHFHFRPIKGEQKCSPHSRVPNTNQKALACSPAVTVATVSCGFNYLWGGLSNWKKPTRQVILLYEMSCLRPKLEIFLHESMYMSSVKV